MIFTGYIREPVLLYFSSGFLNFNLIKISAEKEETLFLFNFCGCANQGSVSYFLKAANCVLGGRRLSHEPPISDTLKVWHFSCSQQPAVITFRRCMCLRRNEYNDASLISGPCWKSSIRHRALIEENHKLLATHKQHDCDFSLKGHYTVALLRKVNNY